MYAATLATSFCLGTIYYPGNNDPLTEILAAACLRGMPFSLQGFFFRLRYDYRSLINGIANCGSRLTARQKMTLTSRENRVALYSGCRSTSRRKRAANTLL